MTPKKDDLERQLLGLKEIAREKMGGWHFGPRLRRKVHERIADLAPSSREFGDATESGQDHHDLVRASGSGSRDWKMYLWQRWRYPYGAVVAAVVLILAVGTVFSLGGWLPFLATGPEGGGGALPGGNLRHGNQPRVPDGIDWAGDQDGGSQYAVVRLDERLLDLDGHLPYELVTLWKVSPGSGGEGSVQLFTIIWAREESAGPEGQWKVVYSEPLPGSEVLAPLRTIELPDSTRQLLMITSRDPGDHRLHHRILGYDGQDITTYLDRTWAALPSQPAAGVVTGGSLVQAGLIQGPGSDHPFRFVFLRLVPEAGLLVLSQRQVQMRVGEYLFLLPVEPDLMQLSSSLAVAEDDGAQGILEMVPGGFRARREGATHLNLRPRPAGELPGLNTWGLKVEVFAQD